MVYNTPHHTTHTHNNHPTRYQLVGNSAVVRRATLGLGVKVDAVDQHSGQQQQRGIAANSAGCWAEEKGE